MNTGTKQRTAARVLASIGTVLAVWKAVYEFVLAETGQMIVAALIATALACAVVIVDVVTTYYNNDYTEEACAGTGLTRQLKAEKAEGYIGDYFFAEDEPSKAEEEAEEDEEEEDYEQEDLETDEQQVVK